MDRGKCDEREDSEKKFFSDFIKPKPREVTVLKQIEYPSFVTNKVCHPVSIIEGVDARYNLTVTINEQYTKVLTYIMMNPSKANNYESDITINKVIKFTANIKNEIYEVGKVSIINLFALYEPKSPSLQKLMEQVMQSPTKYNSYCKSNRRAIEKAISDSEYIVLSWGNIPKGMSAKVHNTEVRHVYDCLKKYEKLDSVYVLKSSSPHHKTILTTKKRPRHPNRIDIAEYIKCSTISLKGNFLTLGFEH